MNILLFQCLEENIVTFAKKELRKLQKVLSLDYPECLEDHCEDEEIIPDEEEEQRRSNEEAFLKFTLQFMRRMKLGELADSLQNSKRPLIDVAVKNDAVNILCNTCIRSVFPLHLAAVEVVVEKQIGMARLVLARPNVLVEKCQMVQNLMTALCCSPVFPTESDF